MVFFLLFSTTKWVGAGKLSIHESLLVALCTFLLMFLVLRYLVVESDEMMTCIICIKKPPFPGDFWSLLPEKKIHGFGGTLFFWILPN